MRSKEAQDGYVYQNFLDLTAPGSGAAPATQSDTAGILASKPLTNEAIVGLVSAGVGEDIIVSMVSTQPGRYSLGADDVVALKKARVSDKIITAMLSSAAHAPGPTSTESADSAPTVKVPDDPGLYAVMSDGALRHIAGRPTSFVRTGSLLASGLTAGIHARRINTQIAGESAYVTVGPRATFYYRVARNAPDQVVPGTLNLILTQMTVKPGRRQFELDASGVLRRSQGISVRHQDNFDAQEIEPGLCELKPDELKSGQYAFFLFIAGPRASEKRIPTTRGRTEREALRGFLYDFQVE